MEMGKEKRLSPRVQLQSSVRYRMVATDDPVFGGAAFQDVSQTGFRFHCREFIPRKASIILEMNLLGQEPVRSLGKAVWVRERPSGEGYEVGGMFVDPPYRARTMLSQLISGIPE